MSVTDGINARAIAWQKYDSVCRAHGTTAERAFAWRRFWKLEMADVADTRARDLAALKREQASKISAPKVGAKS